VRASVARFATAGACRGSLRTLIVGRADPHRKRISLIAALLQFDRAAAFEQTPFAPSGFTQAPTPVYRHLPNTVP